MAPLLYPRPRTSTARPGCTCTQTFVPSSWPTLTRCRALPSAPPQASDINREAKELLRIRDYMDNILAQATGQPFDKVRWR